MKEVKKKIKSVEKHLDNIEGFFSSRKKITDADIKGIIKILVEEARLTNSIIKKMYEIIDMIRDFYKLFTKAIISFSIILVLIILKEPLGWLVESWLKFAFLNWDKISLDTKYSSLVFGVIILLINIGVSLLLRKK